MSDRRRSVFAPRTTSARGSTTSSGEAVGQVVRLASPGSLVGRYPPGNTGRTTMGLTEHADIPADLHELLR
jgi:hypothetical protein